MFVNTKIVIDWGTLEVVHREGFEYDGPVAECKGPSGKTVTNTFDPEYNAGLLEIQRGQEEKADMWHNLSWYGVDYDPTEVDEATGKTLGETRGYDADAQVSERQYMQDLLSYNSALLPLQNEMERKNLDFTGRQLDAAGSLLDDQTRVAREGLNLQSAQIGDSLKTIAERAPIRSEFFSQSLEGKDVGGAMTDAQTNVQQSHDLATQQFKRQLFTAGHGDPSSPAHTSAMNHRNLSLAANIAGARRAAKDATEETNYRRLQTAATTGL